MPELCVSTRNRSMLIGVKAGPVYSAISGEPIAGGPASLVTALVGPGALMFQTLTPAVAARRLGYFRAPAGCFGQDDIHSGHSDILFARLLPLNVCPPRGPPEPFGSFCEALAPLHGSLVADLNSSLSWPTRQLRACCSSALACPNRSCWQQRRHAGRRRAFPTIRVTNLIEALC
jgi:hypothetical protein